MARLTFCYALEKRVKSKKQKEKNNSWQKDQGIFCPYRLFFIYNTVIGYLLLNQHFNQLSSLVFYFLALAVYFIASDWSLRRHHENLYDQHGRFLLPFTSIFGWLLALLVDIGEFSVYVMFAFVSVWMSLNIMKEELPEEQQSSINSFVAGP